jgi:TLD
LDTPEKKKLVYELIGDKRVVTVLRYRGSRDGFNLIDFHSRCDNKGPTISLFKMKSGDVIGGFTTA